MPLASEMMQDVPPLVANASMEEAAQRLAGGLAVLPVVQDAARRYPVGVISRAALAACRDAGHDAGSCPVERHLERDFSLAYPDDEVERTGAASPRRLQAVLVMGDDRRHLGIIPAGEGGLRVTPAHKIEPMVGGWGGMELVWRCGDCGHTVARPASPPERCPGCGGPREHFVLLTED